MIWLFVSPCACMFSTCVIGISEGMGGAMLGIISGMPGIDISSLGFFLNMSISAMVQLFFDNKNLMIFKPLY